MSPAIQVRPAVRRDASLIARLADMAGEGLPLHLWAGMAAPDQDPWDVGRARAARGEGAFSWRNTTVATWRGAAAGMVIDYPLVAVDPPGHDVPALLRPLCELEEVATDTHYINVLAVEPQARRRGVARSLIAHVAGQARVPLTLIVASGNLGARAFYAAEGFGEVARRPMGPGGPPDLTGDWILLRR
ncbi:GNAT family N-acetyltransferase [Jannaschia sp. S6380]|uniref:GNAT family N-acetyltransferase n=1 Tax=Jannaschia sp. S6380 TaxID=2926408 RepID=UPI001FF36628|nr:GNAT family N-acetyltransferase [Jannaschia sp. S6380]MCK0168033.1 GNAT family N-acetyltransferase [Jannaschia sp. S6380]